MAQPLVCQVLFEGPPYSFPQIGTITRTLGTTTEAGFAFVPQIVSNFPFFCSGEVSAVRRNGMRSPDLDLSSYASAEDLRLSEVPALPAARRACFRCSGGRLA